MSVEQNPEVWLKQRIRAATDEWWERDGSVDEYVAEILRIDAEYRAAPEDDIEHRMFRVASVLEELHAYLDSGLRNEVVISHSQIQGYVTEALVIAHRLKVKP